MKRIDAVGVDCQRDFMEGGALPVTGGREDMKRASNVIKRLKKKFTNLYFSLDSHQPFQIFHPYWFLDKNNQHPPGYTPISHQEVVDGVWRASKRSLQDWTLEYTKELENKGRYTHMVWPIHCILYKEGWLLEENIAEALYEWESDNLKRVNFISKGNNPYVENFSALEAEVPRADDMTTKLNRSLIRSLEEADEIVFFGEALSHCVKFTMKSIFDNFSNGEYLKKCVLLTDCSSPVKGFEKHADDFVQEMVAKGMKTSTSADYLA